MVRHVNPNKGITLIELMVYMGIFTVLVAGVLYSAMYLVGVIEYNSFEYAAKENIYRQLELLQHYASISEKIEITEMGAVFYVGERKIEQYVEEGRLHMKYIYSDHTQKELIQYQNALFQKFTFARDGEQDTLGDKTRINVYIERKDTKGQLKTVYEYLITPKVDFSSVP